MLGGETVASGYAAANRPMVRPSEDNINEEEQNVKNENRQDKTDVLAEKSAPCHFVYPISHGG